MLDAPGPDLLSYRAPFVVDKLVMNKTVADRREGARLFEEAKRYLWLTQAHPTRSIPLFSLRVDEAWHQFVLFTPEYAEFCQRCFGRYLHHQPGKAGANDGRIATDWHEFVELYRWAFGEAPPELWQDDRAVVPARRVLRSRDDLAVRAGGTRVELVAGASVLARVNRRAEAALRFMVEHPIFYVRELPGLSAADQVTLCRALVAAQTLRVAP